MELRKLEVIGFGLTVSTSGALFRLPSVLSVGSASKAISAGDSIIMRVGIMRPKVYSIMLAAKKYTMNVEANITTPHVGSEYCSSEDLEELSKFSKFIAEELEKVASTPRRTRCPTAEFIMLAMCSLAFKLSRM